MSQAGCEENFHSQSSVSFHAQQIYRGYPTPGKRFCCAYFNFDGWKEADAILPVLKQAHAEYSRLK
jgi:hypothetical protein